MALKGRKIVFGNYQFDAEEEDEVSFKVGEPIIVIEKDEKYNDGWWKGVTMDGRVGIFPNNYVTKRNICHVDVESLLAIHEKDLNTTKSTEASSNNSTPQLKGINNDDNERYEKNLNESPEKSTLERKSSRNSNKVSSPSITTATTVTATTNTTSSKINNNTHVLPSPIITKEKKENTYKSPMLLHDKAISPKQQNNSDDQRMGRNNINNNYQKYINDEYQENKLNMKNVNDMNSFISKTSPNRSPTQNRSSLLSGSEMDNDLENERNKNTMKIHENRNSNNLENNNIPKEFDNIENNYHFSIISSSSSSKSNSNNSPCLNDSYETNELNLNINSSPTANSHNLRNSPLKRHSSNYSKNNRASSAPTTPLRTVSKQFIISSSKEPSQLGHFSPTRTSRFFDSIMNDDNSENPKNWSVDRVSSWLKNIGYISASKFFKEKNVDGEALVKMNLPILREIGVCTLSERITLLHSILSLKEEYSAKYLNSMTVSIKSNDSYSPTRSKSPIENNSYQVEMNDLYRESLKDNQQTILNKIEEENLKNMSKLNMGGNNQQTDSMYSETLEIHQLYPEKSPQTYFGNGKDQMTLSQYQQYFNISPNTSYTISDQYRRAQIPNISPRSKENASSNQSNGSPNKGQEIILSANQLIKNRNNNPYISSPIKKTPSIPSESNYPLLQSNTIVNPIYANDYQNNGIIRNGSSSLASNPASCIRKSNSDKRHSRHLSFNEEELKKQSNTKSNSSKILKVKEKKQKYLNQYHDFNLATRQSWLFVRFGTFKNWKKRWAILVLDTLYLLKEKYINIEKKPKIVLVLQITSSHSIEPDKPDSKKLYNFKINDPKIGNIHFSAENQLSMITWVNLLVRIIKANPIKQIQLYPLRDNDCNKKIPISSVSNEIINSDVGSHFQKVNTTELKSKKEIELSNKWNEINMLQEQINLLKNEFYNNSAIENNEHIRQSSPNLFSPNYSNNVNNNQIYLNNQQTQQQQQQQYLQQQQLYQQQQIQIQQMLNQQQQRNSGSQNQYLNQNQNHNQALYIDTNLNQMNKNNNNTNYTYQVMPCNNLSFGQNNRKDNQLNIDMDKVRKYQNSDGKYSGGLSTSGKNTICDSEIYRNNCANQINKEFCNNDPMIQSNNNININNTNISSNNYSNSQNNQRHFSDISSIYTPRSEYSNYSSPLFLNDSNVSNKNNKNNKNNNLNSNKFVNNNQKINNNNNSNLISPAMRSDELSSTISGTNVDPYLEINRMNEYNSPYSSYSKDSEKNDNSYQKKQSPFSNTNNIILSSMNKSCEQ